MLIETNSDKISDSVTVFCKLTFNDVCFRCFGGRKVKPCLCWNKGMKMHSGKDSLLLNRADDGDTQELWYRGAPKTTWANILMSVYGVALIALDEVPSMEFLQYGCLYEVLLMACMSFFCCLAMRMRFFCCLSVGFFQLSVICFWLATFLCLNM